MQQVHEVVYIIHLQKQNSFVFLNQLFVIVKEN